MSFLKDDLEAEWGARLRNVALVAEAIRKYDDIESASRIVGAFIKHSGQPAKLLREYPALVLFTVTAVGGANYSEGAFWSNIRDAYNLQNSSPGFQELVGEAYLAGLKHFGLDRYTTPRKYVGLFLIHATIPNASHTKFLRKLIAEYNNNPSLTGEIFNNKFRYLQSSEVQANEIDKPIWHFIRETGAFADLFVDRCIELIIDLADGIRDENGGEGLPENILESLEVLLKNGLQIKKHKLGSRKVGELKPYVYFNDESEEIQVFLPPLESILGRDVVWEVSIGDHIETVHRIKPLNGMAPEKNFISLRSPDKKVVIREKFDGREWVIDLYGDGNLITFGEDSKLMPIKGPIPRGLSTTIYPRILNSKNNFLRSTGNPDRQNLGLLENWAQEGSESNWVITRIDLSDVDSIWIEDSDGLQNQGSVRYVSSSRNPRIDISQGLVSEVQTKSGLAVLSELPVIHLPGIPGNTESFWKIQIQSDTQESQQLSVAYNSTDSKQTLNLVLAEGLYALTVEGRSGTRISRAFYYCPELQIETTPNFRPIAIDGQGLAPALVEIPFLNIAHSLSPSEVSLEVISNSGELLTVTPRHMSLQILKNSVDSKKYFESIRIAKEDLAETRLRIEVDGTRGNALVLKDKNGLVLHHDSGETERDGSLSFNLAKLSDSAGALAVTHLYFNNAVGNSSYIGQISPRKIFQNDPQVIEGKLFIVDEEFPENLMVTFYSKYAPWRKPVRIPVSSSQLEIPNSISELGPFGVTFEIGSLFSFDPIHPRFSAQNPNSQRFAAVQDVEPDSPERGLVHWLLTGTPNEQMRLVDVSVLWHCLTDSTVVGAGHSEIYHRDVASFCAEFLNGDPSAAFLNFPTELHERDSELKLLFLADLIDEMPHAPVTDFCHSATAKKSPALFAILAGGSLAVDSEWKNIALEMWGTSSTRRNEEGEFDGWAFNRLSNCLNLMVTPTKPHPLLQKDFESLFVEFVNAGVVPGALWDSNNWPHQFLYVYKAAEAIQSIAWLRTSASISSAQRLDRELSAFINDTNFSECLSVLASRPMPPEGVSVPGIGNAILAVPSISLRLALAARIAARGSATASEFWHKYKFLHQAISTHMPKLVEFDIVLAELLISHIEGEKNDSN